MALFLTFASSIAPAAHRARSRPDAKSARLLGNDPVLGYPPALDAQEVMAPQADFITLKSAPSRPTGRDHIAFCDGSQVDGELEPVEVRAGFADDLGEGMRASHLRRRLRPVANETGRTYLVRHRELPVPQLEEPTAVELFVDLGRHGARMTKARSRGAAGNRSTRRETVTNALRREVLGRRCRSWAQPKGRVGEAE